jgi:phosphatidylserine decarboxylase
MRQVKYKILMITKYGYDIYFTVATVCFVGIILALLFIEPRSLRYSFIAASLIVFGFATNFFRDPERVTPKGEDFVIAPADGKVIAVKQVMENEFFHSQVWQVSIFMSPIDVHVNRAPITGTVMYTRYVKGEYFAAYQDKASEKNEQMIVGIENAARKVMFKQIAGFIARRIVCPLKPGDKLNAGERFGMIKFGSRVDVFLPIFTDIKVQVGDRTKSGETILGDFSQERLEIKSK